MISWGRHVIRTPPRSKITLRIIRRGLRLRRALYFTAACDCEAGVAFFPAAPARPHTAPAQTRRKTVLGARVRTSLCAHGLRRGCVQTCRRFVPGFGVPFSRRPWAFRICAGSCGGLRRRWEGAVKKMVVVPALIASVVAAPAVLAHFKLHEPA